MKCKIGDLKVLTFYAIRCKLHAYDIGDVPVVESPYYRCLKHKSEEEQLAEFQRYMSAVRQHPENAKNDWGCTASTSYEYFMKLASKIRKEGFDPDKKPRVYRDTSWVEDGHRRLSILCDLEGEGFEVEVVLVGGRPTDINQCSDSCPGRK